MTGGKQDAADAARAASALGWLADAGVDTIVGEIPVNRLAHTRPVAEPRAAEIRIGVPQIPEPQVAEPQVARPRVEAPVPDAPETLETFQDWLRTSSDLPYSAPAALRIGAEGDPASGLMMMTDMPSADDVAAGRLLSGEAGALFDRMLVAIGRSRDTIYLAPLSPVRTPSGTLDSRGSARLAQIGRRHIALAAPRALLLFGDACAKALIGSAVAHARGRWHEIVTPAGPIRALVTIRPENLLRNPKLKTHAWADLQMLMEELKS